MLRVCLIWVALIGAAGISHTRLSDTVAPPCCRCDNGRGHNKEPDDVVCLSEAEMRSHLVRIEPLQMPAYGNQLKMRGVLEMEIRFEADGKVICVRGISGSPLAIASAMEAVPRWRFKGVEMGRKLRGGCGRIHIKYSFSNTESLTSVQ